MKKCKNPYNQNFRRSGRKILGCSQRHMKLQTLCWELFIRKLKMFHSGSEQLEPLSLETHSSDKSQVFQGLETSLRPLALTQPDKNIQAQSQRVRPLRRYISWKEDDSFHSMYLLSGLSFCSGLMNLVLATGFLLLLCYMNVMQVEQCIWTLSVILLLSTVQTSTTQFLAPARNKGPSLLPQVTMATTIYTAQQLVEK